METIDKVTPVIDHNIIEDVYGNNNSTGSENSNDIQAINLICPQYGSANKAELQEI